VISHSTVTYACHIGARALLPHSACESTASFGPDIAAQPGGGFDVIDIIESF